MSTVFTSRPYLLFLGIAAITLVIAFAYFFNDPEAGFELGGEREFSVNSAYAWFFFTGYVLVLAGIYYTAAKGKLKTRRWLVTAHVVFVILFLVLFLAFSSYSSSYVQDHISGLPFFTIVGIYAILFLLDLMSLAAGLLLLLANVLSFKRNGK